METAFGCNCRPNAVENEWTKRWMCDGCGTAVWNGMNCVGVKDEHSGHNIMRRSDKSAHQMRHGDEQCFAKFFYRIVRRNVALSQFRSPYLSMRSHMRMHAAKDRKKWEMERKRKIIINLVLSPLFAYMISLKLSLCRSPPRSVRFQMKTSGTPSYRTLVQLQNKIAYAASAAETHRKLISLVRQFLGEKFDLAVSSYSILFAFQITIYFWKNEKKNDWCEFYIRADLFTMRPKSIFIFLHLFGHFDLYRRPNDKY